MNRHNHAINEIPDIFLSINNIRKKNSGMTTS